jgi:hypothetical protein
MKWVDRLNKRSRLVEKKNFDYEETYAFAVVFLFILFMSLPMSLFIVMSYVNLAIFQNELAKTLLPDLAHFITISKPFNWLDKICWIIFDIFIFYYGIFPFIDNLLDTPLAFIKKTYYRLLDKFCKKLD